MSYYYRHNTVSPLSRPLSTSSSPASGQVSSSGGSICQVPGSPSAGLSDLDVEYAHDDDSLTDSTRPWHYLSESQRVNTGSTLGLAEPLSAETLGPRSSFPGDSVSRSVLSRLEATAAVLSGLSLNNCPTSSPIQHPSGVRGRHPLTYPPSSQYHSTGLRQERRFRSVIPNLPQILEDMQQSEIDSLKEQIEEEELRSQASLQAIADLEEMVKRQQQTVALNIRPGGEWKIRYEAQVKHNASLESEVLHLEEQIAASEEKGKEGAGQRPEIYPDLSDMEVRKLMRQLEKEKVDLNRRIKDMEWRLDSESNAFHKSTEERKTLILQVAEISKSIHQIGLDDAEKAATQISHQKPVGSQSASSQSNVKRRRANPTQAKTTGAAPDTHKRRSGGDVAK